jgi:hypothetical protein
MEDLWRDGILHDDPIDLEKYSEEDSEQEYDLGAILEDWNIRDGSDNTDFHDHLRSK